MRNAVIRSQSGPPKLLALLHSAPLLLAATGCQLHIFSPPARTVALDAPRVLAPAETAIGALGSSTQGIIDSKVYGGTVVARRGLVPGVELQAEGSFYRVSAPDFDKNPGAPQPRANPSLTLLAGRVGTKVALFRNHLSLLGGVGGGHHAAGGFLTPDVGLTFGYDNPLFVPFVMGRVGVSQPIGAKAVDFSRTDEPPGSALEKPITTYYYGFSIGGRIPIEPTGSAVKGGILGGLSFQELRDREDHINGLGFTLGAEVIF